MDMESFVNEKKALKHKVKEFKLYDIQNSEQVLCSLVYADFTDETVVVQNYTEYFVKTAFGTKTAITWQDFNEFLEERCIPRTRAGLYEYLAVYGLLEYDPLKLIEKTQGRMAEDSQWVEVRDL